jgi:hypothetical protein
LVSVAVAGLHSVSVRSSQVCNYLEAEHGTCSAAATASGSDVTVGASSTSGAGKSGKPKAGTTPKKAGKSAAPVKPASPGAVFDERAATWFIVDAPQAPAAAGAITIKDLAAFTPNAAVAHMEPNGWAVFGLNTNFYSVGGNGIKTGALLGQPASVRFIPVGWHWNYGDGTTSALTKGGSTWKAQGLGDFDPTASSHVFRKAGTYTVTLTVEYGAQYQFAGGPWTTVAGTVQLPANRLQITVGKAKTVLVNKDCVQNPRGPGC